MGSIAETERNKMLDALCRNFVYAAPAVYVKLHTGDPGSAGTANPYAVTDRMPGTFNAAATGASTNSNQLEWGAVASAGTVSWCSFWTANAAGTFLGSDDFNTPGTLNAGDTFRIPAGSISISIT